MMRPWRNRLVASMTAAALLAAMPVVALQLVHSERSLYRQVLVYEEAGTRCLCFTRNCTIGRQSCIEMAQPDKLVFDYAHLMLSSLFLVPRPANVLIIGLGGGTLPRALAKILPGTAIDVVEIDPAVVSVARRYFRFAPGPNGQVFEEDGRTYVRRARREGKSYDLIMLDAYDHEYIPEHLLTQEFLREVRALLKPGGIVAANTFSSSRLYDNESVTYRSVFGDFYNLRHNNRIILASNGPLPALATIQQNSAPLTAAFAGLGFSADEQLRSFSTAVDWNPQARVLTDQYSPANLLNSAP
jgi:spermidine synthase